MSNPTIWQLTTDNGTTYDIEDRAARAAAAKGIQLVKCTSAANTPAGVTWDDDGVTVTGTLVASENTTGKIYLVPMENPGDVDVFAEYVTVINEDATPTTYSWEKIGNTDIDLSDLGSLAYKNSASGRYTPAGSVAAPTISVASAGATDSVTPFGSAGTLPSLTMSVSEGNLTFSFNQGTLPSGGTPVTVKTGDASYSASAPAFSGTEATVTVS